MLSTLHTTGAAPTVERIIDACPTGSQNQIRIQLAAALKRIVSQCLIPCGEVKGAARIAGTELLVATDAILNLIREGKTHQISAMMQAGDASAPMRSVQSLTVIILKFCLTDTDLKKTSLL